MCIRDSGTTARILKVIRGGGSCSLQLHCFSLHCPFRVVEAFTTLKGDENIDKDLHFNISQFNLRGLLLELNNNSQVIDVAKFFFSN